MLLIFLWKSVNFSICICVSCTIYGPSLLLNTFKHNISKISVFEKNYNQPTQKNICSKRKNKYLFPILQPVIKKSEINHKNINRRIFFFFNFSSFYLYLALWVTKYLFCKFFFCVQVLLRSTRKIEWEGRIEHLTGYEKKVTQWNKFGVVKKCVRVDRLYWMQIHKIFVFLLKFS